MPKLKGLFEAAGKVAGGQLCSERGLTMEMARMGTKTRTVRRVAISP